MKSMKIAVVGCGALGSYYGAKLLRAGQEVHFLLRSDYDTVRRRGVKVLSREGDFHVQPRCARAPEEIGPCDLVLIGLKTTGNSALPQLLPPLVGPHTAILTLQNGLGNEAFLARHFGKSSVLGGLCFVSLNRLEPGVILHIAHGRIILGEYNRWPEPRTHDIATLIQHAGVPCQVIDQLERAHWEKLMWNIPFNGLGVASAAGYEAVLAGHFPGGTPLLPCLATDGLLGDPRWAGLVTELMDEVERTAQTLGMKLAPDCAEKHLQRTREMITYRASTLIDFEKGLPLELESLFLEPWRQARAAGVATPRLEKLCALLVQLDPAVAPGPGAA